jgi:hypothetical protein
MEKLKIDVHEWKEPDEEHRETSPTRPLPRLK